MKEKNHIRELVSKYNLLLEELDYILKANLIPWLEKRKAVVKDLEIEERDIFEYLKNKIGPFLEKQRKEVSKIREELAK